MNRHYEFWPKRLPKTLDAPKTSMYDNLKVSARRYPEKIAIHYYGGSITYHCLSDEVEALAGYLQRKLGVNKNDRVLLFYVKFSAICDRILCNFKGKCSGRAHESYECYQGTGVL